MPRATQRDGLGEVVRTGDRLASLVAIRDRLADLLQTAEDKTAAGLAQRLVAVMAEIDALSGPREESTVDRLRDDLAARRAHRREAAAGP